ncbi:MAG: response regulator transcription factor [Roseivirga sp.]|nr:response regulator transcription factor [Roseivirga sp.]
MHKARIVIIEDEFFAAEHVKDLVNSLGFWVVGVYHSGEDFLKNTQWNFDAAIVDIFLSEKLNGLDVARKLKEHKKPFVFLTANQDSITLREAAHLQPVSYISKPFKTNDVAAALEIIAHKLPKMLEVRGANGVEQLNPNDIIFIKSDGVYIELHTVNGMVVQRKLLKDIMDQLPDFFIRVHRSYLVNVNYIGQRSSSHLIVKGKEIPVSRGFRENLLLL